MSRYHWTAILAPKRWARVLVGTECNQRRDQLLTSESTELHLRNDQHICMGSAVCRRCDHRPSSNTRSRYQLLPLIRASAVARVSYLPGSEFVVFVAQCFHNPANNVVVRMHLQVSQQDSSLGIHTNAERTVALSLVAFVGATVAPLARAPSFQSSKAVWVTFVDLSGWNNEGIVFLIGLLTPGYMYAGIDGVIHLAEEATNAREAIPKALLSTWSIGFVTSFIAAIACMYSAQDFDAIATTPTG